MPKPTEVPPKPPPEEKPPKPPVEPPKPPPEEKPPKDKDKDKPPKDPPPPTPPVDTMWGRYDYWVTEEQKETLDGLWYLLRGLPRAYDNPDSLPVGGFYLQQPTGDVVIGLHHCSVTVHRNGRLSVNRGGEYEMPNN